MVYKIPFVENYRCLFFSKIGFWLEKMEVSLTFFQPSTQIWKTLVINLKNIYNESTGRDLSKKPHLVLSTIFLNRNCTRSKGVGGGGLLK